MEVSSSSVCEDTVLVQVCEGDAHPAPKTRRRRGQRAFGVFPSFGEWMARNTENPAVMVVSGEAALCAFTLYYTARSRYV